MATPKLKYLLACENANGIKLPNGDVKVVIASPLVKMSVPFIPTQITFDAAAGIVDLEMNKQYIINLSIVDPNGTVVDAQEMAAIQPPSNDSADPYYLIFFSFRNVVITCRGNYSVKVYLDGNYLDEYTFLVFGQEK